MPVRSSAPAWSRRYRVPGQDRAAPCALRHLELGGDEHQEVAVLAGEGTVGERGQAEILAAEGVEQLKVLADDRLLAVEGERHLLVVGPLQGNGVCGTVDVLDAVLRFEGGLERETVERGRGPTVGLHRIDVGHQFALALGNAGVRHRHLLIAVRGDGEDAHVHQAVAEVFQQAGILARRTMSV